MIFSACIEMLFVREAAAPADRIAFVAESGLPAFEFWHWQNKDLGAIEAAMRRTGLELTGLVAEPMIALNDASNHDAFLEGLRSSVDVARRLGAPILIAQAGDERPDMPRAAQRDTIAECLARAADVLAGSGVRLALEPLNTRVDHPGYFLDATPEGLDIADAVDRPEIGILYDLYHSMVMDEATETVLAGRVHRVFHVHVADHPGRTEPGSGRLPLAAALKWLADNGYAGAVGLEFRPTGGSAAAVDAALRSLLGRPTNGE
jgi:hydroxypyruvate isomerase